MWSSSSCSDISHQEHTWSSVIDVSPLAPPPASNTHPPPPARLSLPCTEQWKTPALSTLYQNWITVSTVSHLLWVNRKWCPWRQGVKPTLFQGSQIPFHQFSIPTMTQTRSESLFFYFFLTCTGLFCMTSVSQKTEVDDTCSSSHLKKISSSLSHFTCTHSPHLWPEAHENILCFYPFCSVSVAGYCGRRN